MQGLNQHLRRALGVLALLLLTTHATPAAAEPLKIGYSDWPGWVAWEVGIQKGWFEEAGVEAEFIWFEYAPSMDAYAAGQIDAVCMTNGDALVTGASGKPSKAILINDYSNGNDMVVARPGIRQVPQLKGKKIGVELGLVGHLLLLKGLEAHGMRESDVELVNMPTHQTPQALASKGVDAVVAWQPNSGEALKMMAGSRPIYTSADSPGIIYDLLYVSNESLAAERAEWKKVVKVWFRIADYLRDEINRDDFLQINERPRRPLSRRLRPLYEGHLYHEPGREQGPLYGCGRPGVGLWFQPYRRCLQRRQQGL